MWDKNKQKRTNRCCLMLSKKWGSNQTFRIEYTDVHVAEKRALDSQLTRFWVSNRTYWIKNFKMNIPKSECVIGRALWFPWCKKANGSMESSHKNWFYHIMRNVMEFAKLLRINKKHKLVSVNIRPQKDHLNMNPACSLCEWMGQTHGLIYFTHTEACDTHGVFSLGSHEHYLQSCSESRFMSFIPFHLRKWSYHIQIII